MDDSNTSKSSSDNESSVSSTNSSESKTEEIKKKNDSEIDVPKDLESNSEGLVTVAGKVTSDSVKQIFVKNSLDDQEKTVDIQSDLSFTFDIQMNDASSSLIIRLCNSEYKDELSIIDWKEISVQANSEFHQKYIDRLTNDMENIEDSST